MRPMGPLAAPAQVLDFWFDQPRSTQPLKKWFVKDADFDQTVAQRFGATVQAALDTGLQDWPDSSCTEAEIQLARIVLLDQFTRNIFRNTPRAFAGDAQALALAQALVASGADQPLPPLQRWFVYLPFEHSESRSVQAESLRLFDALAAQFPATAEAREWAVKHQVIVEQFGRYPHRNLVLGRLSTPDEEAFLQAPGSSF